MNRKQQFIERRPEGDYAVRKPNCNRASVVKATQAEAATQIGATRTSGGGPRPVTGSRWFLTKPLPAAQAETTPARSSEH